MLTVSYSVILICWLLLPSRFLVRFSTHVRHARDLFPGTELASQRTYAHRTTYTGRICTSLTKIVPRTSGALPFYRHINIGALSQPHHEAIVIHSDSGAICEHYSSTDVKVR